MGQNMKGSHKSLKRAGVLAACTAAIALTGTIAPAAVFPEVEPNDAKFAANPVGPMVATDSITGLSTGTSTTVPGLSSADNFLINFPAAIPGIYQNRLVLTSNTPGHTGTIRGLTQAAAPPDTLAGIPWDGVVGSANAGTDSTIQTSSTLTTPPRYNQFYTFGQPTQMYYRVTGTTSTTTDYTSTLETQRITPPNIGTYVPGLITMNWTGQGHTTDTDMWVYDGNFNAIAGYGDDDSSAALSGAPIATTSLQSWLARDYTPGTYYIAVSNFSTANNQPAASDDNFRTGTLMDFAGVIANSSTTINLNMTFTITDSAGNTLQVQNTKLSQYDINFFEFTVVPEPGSLGLLALGAPMLLRRRK
jgi:hypothetical protein